MITAPYKALLITIYFGLFAAQPASSQSPTLQLPLECTLSETCWIARYMDRAADNNKADYLNGLQTQDKHKGTDFTIGDIGAMERGVAVLAAASGKVLRLRDGMPDTVLDEVGNNAIAGRECGNALILEHENGWQTQYCHLKQNSIKVKIGDRVNAGTPMAQVGLSGQTEFPHLHFMVRQIKAAKPPLDIDPFDGGLFERTTIKPSTHTSLWQHVPPYTNAVVLPPLVTTARTNRHTMWRAQQAINGDTADALIIQARGFHTRAGDIWRFTLYEPGGRERFTQDIEQNNTRQLVQAFAGIKRPTAGLIPGTWLAEVSLIRMGKILDTRTQLVTVITAGAALR